MNIPSNHPRFESLMIRERLVHAMSNGTVVPQGLLAHGRGEAFDYILGERTNKFARRAITAAAAHLLLAANPVISANGNATALVSTEIAELARTVPAKVEVNLFHRTNGRELEIASWLKKAGVKEILGIGSRASARIFRVSSRRAQVDPIGIQASDVVLIPLEDGDRAAALQRLRKTVIAIDLNPLSRTSKVASVTIVDNIVRAFPTLVSTVKRLKPSPKTKLKRIILSFDNRENLSGSMEEMIRFLRGQKQC